MLTGTGAHPSGQATGDGRDRQDCRQPPLLRLAAGALFFFLARRNRPAGAVLLAVGGFCLAVDLAAVVLNRLSIDFWDAPAPFSWILFDENTLSLFSGVFFLGLGAVRAKRA